MGESIYDRLGIRQVILGKGWYTHFGGSIMPPEVVQAMASAVPYYVDIVDLHHKAGAIIARATGAQAGLVTAGASAGLVLMAAACMTGPDPAKVARLPDASGLKNEVIMQRCQRNRYDGAFTLAGARIVEVGTAETASLSDIEAAITDNTAAVACVKSMYVRHPLPLEAVVRTAHRHGVPVIVDAAPALPPAQNLRGFIAVGADMVTFSGGKGIRGPQSTGFLCGRADLVQAATRHALSFDAPREGVGRPMKVCKEEIVGLLAALDLFERTDHQAQRLSWSRQSKTIVDTLEDIRGIRACLEDDDQDHPSAAAVAYLEPSWTGPTGPEVTQTLQHGNPSIEIGYGGYKEALWAVPVSLRPGDEEIIAQRLLEALTSR